MNLKNLSLLSRLSILLFAVSMCITGCKKDSSITPEKSSSLQKQPAKVAGDVRINAK